MKSTKIKYSRNAVNVQVPLVADGTATITGALTASSSAAFASGASMNGKLALNAGLSLQRVTTSTALTATTADIIVGVDCSGGAITVTLPAVGSSLESAIIVKDESGDAGTNTITIVGTVDGSANLEISTNYGASRLYCDGSGWLTW